MVSSLTKRIYAKVLVRDGGIWFLLIDPTGEQWLRYRYLYADVVEGRLLPQEVSVIARRVRDAIPTNFSPSAEGDREVLCVYADVDVKQPLWAPGYEDQRVGIRSGAGLVIGPDPIADFNPEIPDALSVRNCVPLDEELPRAIRRAFGLP